MKKDRNCGMNIPIYPNYKPNMMPGIPPMNMMYNPNDIGDMNMNYSNSSNSYPGSIEQQLSSLSSQVSSLERRVNNLENLIGNNNTTYNTTNYQML